jgi:hypothetical protein
MRNRGILTLTLQTTWRFAERLKMRVRLNGWQRIGIVLSVVWALVGYFLANAYYSDMAAGYARFSTISCFSTPQINIGECYIISEMECLVAAGIWDNAVTASLVPVLLALLIAYAFIGLWRWIRRGFNAAISR